MFSSKIGKDLRVQETSGFSLSRGWVQTFETYLPQAEEPLVTVEHKEKSAVSPPSLILPF